MRGLVRVKVRPDAGTLVACVPELVHVDSTELLESGRRKSGQLNAHLHLLLALADYLMTTYVTL